MNAKIAEVEVHDLPLDVFPLEGSQKFWGIYRTGEAGLPWHRIGFLFDYDKKEAAIATARRYIKNSRTRHLVSACILPIANGCVIKNIPAKQ